MRMPDVELIADPLPAVLEVLEEEAWDRIVALRQAGDLPADERLAEVAAIAVQAAVKLRWLRECNPR